MIEIPEERRAKEGAIVNIRINVVRAVEYYHTSPNRVTIVEWERGQVPRAYGATRYGKEKFFQVAGVPSSRLYALEQ